VGSDFASVAEASGYIASGLVFLTFCMKTMIALRVIAIGSNIAFIVYGLIADLTPIYLLHTILLPLNIMRLWQSQTLIREVRQAAAGDLSLNWLLPFMKMERRRAGELLFGKGEIADKMYVVSDGVVTVEEIGLDLGEGQVFGEISLFSRDARRTASIRCKTDVTLMAIHRDKVLELYYQNPKFGFYLVQLITERLIENASNAPAAQEAAQLRASKAAAE
jgi:CRP/FNR family cyclic AMP-dependent transcriptional regulator